jgi:hypothetical protein
MLACSGFQVSGNGANGATNGKEVAKESFAAPNGAIEEL